MTVTAEPSTPVQDLPLPPVNARVLYHGFKFTKTAFTGFEDNDNGWKIAKDKVDLVRVTFPRIGPNRVFDTLLEQWTGDNVLVASPRAVRELYSLPPEVVDQEQGAKLTVLVMGSESPFYLTGRDHVEARRILVSEFSANKVKQYHDVSLQVVDRMIDELPLNEPVQLLEFYTRMTQEILLRVAFGLEPGPELEEYKAALYEAGMHIMPEKLRHLRLFRYMFSAMIAFPVKSRTPIQPVAGRDEMVSKVWSPRGYRIRRRADALIARKVQEFRRQPNDSVIAHIVAYGDEHGWTDKRLRDVIATLLIAGHDTSISAYSWATEFLMHNPGPRAKLIAEAMAGTGNKYAEAANLEATRLKSPVWGMPSLATQDFALAGHRVRKGSFVMVFNPALHLDEELYPNPLEFRPERFLEKAPDRHGFMTFNAGRHRCPGTAFYLMEASLVMQRMFGRLEIQPTLPEVDKTYMSFGFFNRPRHRTVVTIRGRKPASDVPVYSPAAAGSPLEASLREDEAADRGTGCPFSGAQA